MPTEIVPQIVYGAVLLFVLGAVGALWHRMGGIQRDVGRLEANVATLQTSLNEKTDALRTDLNERIDGLRTDLNEKTDALRTDLNERIDGLRADTNEKFAALQASIDALAKAQHEMQLQMQRNHYQLMMAILSHSHRPDGRPTFDLPPDFEPPPASE